MQAEPGQYSQDELSLVGVQAGPGLQLWDKLVDVRGEECRKCFLLSVSPCSLRRAPSASSSTQPLSPWALEVQALRQSQRSLLIAATSVLMARSLALGFPGCSCMTGDGISPGVGFVASPRIPPAANCQSMRWVSEKVLETTH